MIQKLIIWITKSLQDVSFSCSNSFFCHIEKQNKTLSFCSLSQGCWKNKAWNLTRFRRICSSDIKQSSDLSQQPFKIYLNEQNLWDFPRQSPQPKSTSWKYWSIHWIQFCKQTWEPGRFPRVYKGLNSKALHLGTTFDFLWLLPLVSESKSCEVLLYNCLCHLSYTGSSRI